MRIANVGLVVRRAALFVLLSVQCVAAHAIVVGLEGLRVVKNNVPILDTFSDGVPPPSGPLGPSSYGVQGVVSEANGRLTMDSSVGALTLNAVGGARLNTAITLLTSVTVPEFGLWVTDNISSLARFDLATPTGPVFNAYGIQLNDAGPGIPISENLQLAVEYLEGLGAPAIRFVNQDFANDVVNPLGFVLLSPPAGADQIDLFFTRVLDETGALTNQFRAGFNFLSGGNVIDTYSFAQLGTMFEGEDFVRTRVYVAEAVVPEPSTYALMIVGLLGLGWIARRRAAK